MRRIFIFIDGNNFYHGLRYIYKEDRKAIDFNFKNFCDFLSNKWEIVGICYYNAELDKSKNIDKYYSQQRFFSKLKMIPKLRLVLCKLLKRKLSGTNKYYYVLKEDDIHMAVDIVEGACEDLFDIAIIVSGDGDFVPAVKAVHRKNKTVENVYFKKSSSRHLKEHCDSSFELTKDILDNFFEDYAGSEKNAL